MNVVGKPDGARVFFALSPGERCRRRLFAVANDFAARLGGRPMPKETLHLTLVFVGEVGLDRLPGLRAAAGEVAQATAGGSVVLNRLHHHPAGKMLWAASEHCSPPLGALAEGLRRSLLARGFTLEARPFVAHVTLLRRLTVRPPAGDLDALKNVPIRWRYRDFVLLRSRSGPGGSVYEPLGAWTLGGN
ncbi:MAG: 2-5 ligase [Proteobacteria bacterium]|nr:2-5 ligase [Pseudomonadota bacterium]